jgi:hypothetical protein
MDAAGLIAILVDLERAAGKAGDIVTRDIVIEAQDWILSIQKENLELRRANYALRIGAPVSAEPAEPDPKSGIETPFSFQFFAQRLRRPDQVGAS